MLFEDVVIHHTGYRDAGLPQRQLKCDQRLVELEQAEHPFTLFNLGSILQEEGRHPETRGMMAGFRRLKSLPSGDRTTDPRRNGQWQRAIASAALANTSSPI